MLRIIIGKAGTGKSAAIMAEIADAVRRQEGNSVLLVPEQYSHEAERELCERCGDSLSLYAEVLSFTAFARKLSSELGGAAVPYLDKGGRLLCMALAADGLYSRLRMYPAARRKAELQTVLLSAIDELKTACVSPEQLMQASNECVGALSDKLHDLSLLLEAYDAVTANGHADPTDRLTVLARQIEVSSIDEKTSIYIDGFTDFTAQERRVIEALLLKGACVTLCISCDSLSGGSEIFELTRIMARRLIGFAKENAIEFELEEFKGSSGKNAALSFCTEQMFVYSSERYEGECDSVQIALAASAAQECELAAAHALRLVRETGCRWRDIAVAVRGFSDYSLALESAFSRYGVPLYTARKTDLMAKPIPALIAYAYEIIDGGWECDDVLGYLRTDLVGLSSDECDELENYMLMWQLRGSAWTDNTDWRLNPEGFTDKLEDSSREKLRSVNALRRRVSAPLLHFAENAKNAQTAAEQAKALAGLLEELGLAERLEKKSRRLVESGRAATAQEYAQLWDITVSALEQCAAILGDTQTELSSFARLFTLMLSKYDVGTIPAALDRVTAGDFDRMRRRNIKHLIVLGASDTRLPQSSEEAGVFSRDERRRLLEMDIDLGGVGDSELWREFSLIYNCLTLPSESMLISYCAFDEKGEPQRAAFVVNRIRACLGLEVKAAASDEIKMNARAPALELAANAFNGAGTASASAAQLFETLKPERMQMLRAAAQSSRGSLSRRSVDALYGKNIKLSASKIDKFASCRFAYFMQYGLKAKTREPAGFTPPEMGIFMHYILEHTAKDVMLCGGFKSVTDEKLRQITDGHIAQYVHDTLNDFKEKSKRFEYLFRRLTGSVYQVVQDMADELRASDFEPLSFELDFGKSDILPPLKLGEGDDSLVLTGIADRVDGWVHDGRLYLRVVDYKTGKKSFSLSDVWYGMGLQMLLYLFSLGENGQLLYGKPIVPAGVLYIPARDVILSSKTDLSDEEIASERADEIKRSGLILDEPEVINAMEHSDKPRYIPVKFKGGVPTGDALASAERFGLLARHIDETLRKMACELKQGSIAADPFYRSQQENACLHCDYFDACHFADGENGEQVNPMPKLAATRVWNILEGGEGNG